MTSDQIRQAEDAARFLTRILGNFQGLSIYKTYKDVEHFTDKEYEDAFDILEEFGNGIVTERPVG